MSRIRRRFAHVVLPVESWQRAVDDDLKAIQSGQDQLVKAASLQTELGVYQVQAATPSGWAILIACLVLVISVVSLGLSLLISVNDQSLSNDASRDRAASVSAHQAVDSDLLSAQFAIIPAFATISGKPTPSQVNDALAAAQSARNTLNEAVSLQHQADTADGLAAKADRAATHFQVPATIGLAASSAGAGAALSWLLGSGLDAFSKMRATKRIIAAVDDAKKPG